MRSSGSRLSARAARRRRSRSRSPSLELEELLRWAAERDTAVAVVGLGSNLLVADEGVDALVLRLRGDLAGVSVEGDVLRAGGGAANAVCLHRARAAGLGAFEFACAIPGTIGGGVWMNAGAYDGEFSQVLERALVATAAGSGWLYAGGARVVVPSLGAPSRAGRRRGGAAAEAAAAGGDPSRRSRAQRAAQGSPADEPEDVRERVQESGARAQRRPDARGVRPEGPSHRRRTDLTQARQLHRERRQARRRRTRSR